MLRYISTPNAIQYNAMQYNTMQCNAMQYNTISVFVAVDCSRNVLNNAGNVLTFFQWLLQFWENGSSGIHIVNSN